MALSLLSLLYLSNILPYKKKYNNNLNIFNELSTILVAYLVMVINGVVVEVNSQQDAGEMIRWFLYFNWSVNAAIILYQTVLSIR